MLVWKRRLRLARASAVVALSAAVTWALWPLPAPSPVDPGIDVVPTPEPDDHEQRPFDRAAFTALIWNPPPQPQTIASPPPRETPAPPPKLQLVGIVHDPAAGAAVLRAALYDPDSGTLHISAAGDLIGSIRVAAVDAYGVDLEAGARHARLSLKVEGNAK